jgi:ParB/RepB/Spo0J family partition protein
MQRIKLDQIKPSKTNPRKHFDTKAMLELAESIRKHGILQPILVREVETSFYEIVAGERRFHAAKDAGLKEIPATILTITDKEAVEIQVIENLQRADLHPMEEAEGYQQLMKQYGYGTADEIAAKIGKSRSYVYGRMKLCGLCPEAKKAFLKGELNASVALLLARVPEALQEKAAKTVLHGKYGEGPLSYRDAAQFIQNNFTLSLVGAPFNPKVADLIPGCGACTACSKRTGSEPELFSDIKSADVCTDPECFEKKREAAWKLKTEAKNQHGYTVLPAAKAKRLFYGNSLNSFQHVELDSVCEDDKKRRTYRELIPAVDPKLVLIASDEKGKAHEIMKRSDAQLQLKNAGYKFAEERAKREEESKPKERTSEEIAAADRAKKIEDLALDTAMDDLQERLADGTADHRKALLAYAVATFTNQYIPEALVKRHGFKSRDQFEKRLPKMPVTSPLDGEGDTAFRKLIGMLLESVSEYVNDAPAFFKDFGVDLESHRKAAEEKTPVTKAKKK